MRTQNKRIKLAAALAMAVVIPVGTSRADEVGSHTPFYEDDAWYDVSEWFDGNDYNPTDEAIGRWDNETFSLADNRESTDSDNDWNSAGLAGYRSGNESDWFYDYYDDGYGRWEYNSYSRFYDSNQDGVYDSYAMYEDNDGDGIYDELNYYATDSASDEGQQQKSEQLAANGQKVLRGKTASVAGTVAKSKMVQVRDEMSLIVMVESADGKQSYVDMGTNQDDLQLFKGDQVAIEGHLLQVNNKPILVAEKASMKNGTIAIDRDGRQFRGEIESTKTIDVRGQKNQMAKIKTSDGKTMLVDLGPVDALSQKVNEGQTVSVRGVPIKVKDRIVLVARRLMQNGDETMIRRTRENSAG